MDSGTLNLQLQETFSRLLGEPILHADAAGDPVPYWRGPGFELRLRDRASVPVVEFRRVAGGRFDPGPLQFTEIRTQAQAGLITTYLRSLVQEGIGRVRKAGRNARAESPSDGISHSLPDGARSDRLPSRRRSARESDR